VGSHEGIGRLSALFVLTGTRPRFRLEAIVPRIVTTMSTATCPQCGRVKRVPPNPQGRKLLCKCGMRFRAKLAKKTATTTSTDIIPALSSGSTKATKSRSTEVMKVPSSAATPEVKR
jgi:hypothetical protein